MCVIHAIAIDQCYTGDCADRKTTLGRPDSTVGIEHCDVNSAVRDLGLIRVRDAGACVPATLHQQGRHNQAGRMAEHILTVNRARLGPEHEGTLVSLGNLARLLGCQKRFEEAGIYISIYIYRYMCVCMICYPYM